MLNFKNIFNTTKVTKNIVQSRLSFRQDCTQQPNESTAQSFTPLLFPCQKREMFKTSFYLISL